MAMDGRGKRIERGETINALARERGTHHVLLLERSFTGEDTTPVRADIYGAVNDGEHRTGTSRLPYSREIP